MGLGLRQDLLTNATGAELWVYDKTLVYGAVNLTGWGAPNPDLNKSALLAFVKRVDADGSLPLTPLSSAISYSAADANTFQRAIGFTYIEDGHYTSYMFMLPVSADGDTTLAGDTILTDDYFLMSGSVYKKNSDTTNTLITDYSTLVDVSSIQKVQGEFIFFNHLSLKNMLQYYRQWRDARKGNDPELESQLREKMGKLKIDIAGASWLFTAGLYTQAENTVADLLEEHGITNPLLP